MERIYHNSFYLNADNNSTANLGRNPLQCRDTGCGVGALSRMNWLFILACVAKDICLNPQSRGPAGP